MYHQRNGSAAPPYSLVTWFEKLERTVVSTHRSRSASAKTRAGFLPPSSRDSFLQKGALSSVMIRAVAVEPVKEMRGTSGWATRALPALGPEPNTTLTTPGGTPAHRDTGGSAAVAHLLHDGRCRPTGLLHQPAQHPGGHRGHLAGLGHHRVPRRDGGRDLPGEQVEGEIPGADQTGCRHRTQTHGGDQERRGGGT